MTHSVAEAKTLTDHEVRLRAARAVAGWNLGDRNWADFLVAAYCNPDQALERLTHERGEEN